MDLSSRYAAIPGSISTLVWPPTRLSKVRTRTRLEDNHTSALPDENGPKYVGGSQRKRNTIHHADRSLRVIESGGPGVRDADGAHRVECSPESRGEPDETFARQPTISTSSVRGPCTPSTLSSSMSEVADGPEIKVTALPSPSTALSRPAKASGTRPTICRSCTTHRW